MYSDDVQLHVGDAVHASRIPREKLCDFKGSMLPCRSLTGWCSWYAKEYKDVDVATRARIDSVY